MPPQPPCPVTRRPSHMPNSCAAATQRMGAEEETIPGQEAIKDYVKGQAWNVTTKFVVGTTMPSGYVRDRRVHHDRRQSGATAVGIDCFRPGGLPDAEGGYLHENHRQHHCSVLAHERRVFHPPQ